MPQKQSIIQTPGQIGEEDKIAGNVFKTYKWLFRSIQLMPVPVIIRHGKLLLMAH